MKNMLNKNLYNGLRAAGVSDENAQRIAAEAAKYDIYFNSLDGSIKGLYTYVDKSLSRQEAKMDRQFNKIDERFAKIDERFAKIDERFAKKERQMTGDRIMRRALFGVTLTLLGTIIALLFRLYTM